MNKPTLSLHGMGVVTDACPDLQLLAEAMHLKIPESLIIRDVQASAIRFDVLDPQAVAQHDQLAQLAIRSAHQACTMAELAATPGDRIALLFVSAWGTIDATVAYLESMFEDHGRYASPRHFSRSVYSSVASLTAIHFKIHGPCQTLSFATDPVRGALVQAKRILFANRADRVLVIWAEQAAELAQDLSRRAVLSLGRKEYKRYIENLGYGAIGVVVGRETGNHITADPPVKQNAQPDDKPFAMDEALQYLTSLLLNIADELTDKKYG